MLTRPPSPTLKTLRALERGKAPEALGNPVHVEAGTAPASALDEVSAGLFGRPVSPRLLPNLVDAVEGSELVARPHASGALEVSVFHPANANLLLEKHVFAPTSSGVDVRHGLFAESPRADRAPVFGEPSPATFGRVDALEVQERWAPEADPITGEYLELLPHGRGLVSSHPTSVNEVTRHLFCAPGTEPGPSEHGLTAAQLADALVVLPDGLAYLDGYPAGSEPNHTLQVEVLYPGEQLSDTRAYVQEHGKTFHYQSFAGVEASGQGTGLDVFSRVMQAGHAYGVHAIRADAAGFGLGNTQRREGGEYVGYYVWPRFGFNGPIPGDLRASMPRSLKPARDLLDLFARPGGPSWWKAHGQEVEVEYLLDPNGPNVAATQRYLMEKAAARRAAG